MKILLAADGSAHARLAECLLAKLPEARGAEIVAASVTAPLTIPTDGLSGLPPEQVGNLWNDIREHTELIANAAADRLKQRGFNARAVALVGDVTESLLDLSKDERVNLIAVGSRGENALIGFFLGSTARRLLAYADCSVLVARTDEGAEPEATIQRLEAKSKLSALVAYDGTDGAELSLARVISQGAAAFERVVVGCAEPLAVLPFGMTPMGLPHSLATVDEKRVAALVEGALPKLGNVADSTSTATRLGRPANLICSMAQDEHVDLVVLGATRHGFIERFLLGSVSNELATTAPCSVLVVRPSPGG